MFAHWGTFTKPDSWGNCLAFAQGAVKENGYQVWDNGFDGDYIVIAGNNDVIVNVTCVPQNNGTWIAVSAYSTNSSIAENARNSVRAKIVNMHTID